MAPTPTLTPTSGIVFRPQSPPEDLQPVVRAAEEAGTAELWLWEDCFLEGGLTAATAALAWSGRLQVGIGLLPVPLRNAAVTAMELATLARMFPGRLVATLGHGVQEWMAQVGVAVDSPMTLLREHATAVRDLLDGRTVAVDGRYVHLDSVALDWPPQARPLLLVGARGPRSIALAGEVADGVLLDSVPGTDAQAVAVRRGRLLLDEGRARSGRGGRAQLSAYTEVDPTGPGLARRLAERVAALGEAGADAVIVHGTAEAPDPRPFLEAGLPGRSA